MVILQEVVTDTDSSDSDDESGSSSDNSGLCLATNDGNSAERIGDDKGKGKSDGYDWNLSKESRDMIMKWDVETMLEDLKFLRSESRKQTNIFDSWLKETRKERFRDTAKRHASRLATFEPQDEQEKNFSNHEIPSAQNLPPFSTAIETNSQQGRSTSKEANPGSITWIPRKRRDSNRSRRSVPSLLDLSMKILAKNVEALTSLERIPDELRHRLCDILCDSRGMNTSFLQLLLRGSPTEIRIKDCSWLTEEDFTKYFGACNTSKLSVLQLDQCGRCVADYLLPATLARSSRSMSALITLSLRGASRLTNIGLVSLVSAAPALRSINLSQCSLLTSVGIDTLAQSLGSHLLELYIDDCQSLDARLILPALKKLEHLEVLSLDGIETVSDNFMIAFGVERGHNMKELVLANCTNLTDFAIGVIGQTCPGLCAPDLVNLSKLTDDTLGYLANRCQKIQTLKFCRNAFSDEAIAAFLETSGEPLKELSLNHVTKVGNNTALALARRSRNLVKLDLSWCRNLTNEAVGLIVDSCSSLKVLKLFGCSQITDVFLNGHSNEVVEIIGLKLSPLLKNVPVPDSEEFPLRNTSPEHPPF